MSEASASRPVGVVVAVDLDRYAQVMEAARRVGLVVTSEQPVLGTLAGTIADDRLPALEALEGVEAVDREHVIRLPPPGSPTR
ncbi:hypothetical protein ACFWXA_36240 [Streptomyces atroolivaceus]|uniref:hypothetical protein n=1 Tax=Streptomyces atroolivaceus TaxID=66869 RepID=UPI00364DAAC9